MTKSETSLTVVKQTFNDGSETTRPGRGINNLIKRKNFGVGLTKNMQMCVWVGGWVWLTPNACGLSQMDMDTIRLCTCTSMQISRFDSTGKRE